MIQRQTVKQHKAIRQRILTNQEVTERHYRLQAQQEINERWIIPRFILVLILLVGGLSLSHFTDFRAHLTQWLVTGVFPADHWYIIVGYVVSFLILVALFVWATRYVDQIVEGKIARRYHNLLEAHHKKNYTGA